MLFFFGGKEGVVKDKTQRYKVTVLVFHAQENEKKKNDNRGFSFYLNYYIVSVEVLVGLLFTLIYTEYKCFQVGTL